MAGEPCRTGPDTFDALAEERARGRLDGYCIRGQWRYARWQVVEDDYSRDTLPPELKKAPFVAKPMSESELIDTARSTF